MPRTPYRASEHSQQPIMPYHPSINLLPAKSIIATTNLLTTELLLGFQSVEAGFMPLSL